jgi:dihydroorotase
VSTAKSLQLIKDAKEKGIAVSCSVTPYHLMFCDEDLAGYDTNLKTDPPLRTREDMMALRKALLEGTIDCIATHHFPQDWDHKTCEFEYAAPGMIGLETTFGVINQLFPQMATEELVKLFAANARKIFAINSNVIEEKAKADLTLFERETLVTFKQSDIKSKSKNSPFINKQLKGKVIGIINKGRVYLNDKY